jgi:hypothetical protein
MIASEELYLDLIARTLTGMLYEDPSVGPWPERNFDTDLREHGRDWPSRAQTMVGMKRLANVRLCAESVIRDEVAGDFIETGVWRGGAAIFMRAILKAHRITDRLVWLADSFQGLPPPNPEAYPADAGDINHTMDALAVSLEEVKSNFSRYGLLDEQVRFLKGWFRDTLPAAPVDRLALLRLDGDMYESTWDALVNLYPKLSPGGYAIVDDYGAVPACRQAVDDFRRAQNVTDKLREIDWTGVYWRRSSP